MNIFKLTLIGMLMLFLNGISYGQFSIDGEFRTRTIANHGYKYPALENSEAVFSVDQRSRLIFNYSAEKYNAKLSLQDARIWGGDDMYTKTGIEGNSYSFGIHEAWIDLMLSEKSWLRVGRQEWNYNDMRVLSWKNWWTSGMAYDALLFHREDKDNGLFIDLGLSYNNNGSNNGSVDNSDWSVDKIKSMNFLNVRKNLGDKSSLALMFSLSTKVDTSNNAQLETGTHGLYFSHNAAGKKEDGAFGTLSAYYQHGTDMKRASSGDYKSISAYLFAVEAGYRSMGGKLETSVGVELISGQDYSNTDTDYNSKRHTFDLVYGNRFLYYGGNMNHYVVQESFLLGTKGGGYLDPYVKLKYKLNKKNLVSAGLYMPMLTTDVRAHTSIDPVTKKPTGAEVDANGNPIFWKGSLGTYVDLGYVHKLSKGVVVKSGFSYGIPSDIKNQMAFGYQDAATSQLSTLGHNYFGWVMLVVKPKFLGE